MSERIVHLNGEVIKSKISELVKWGCKKYMNMKHLEEIEDINAIA